MNVVVACPKRLAFPKRRARASRGFTLIELIIAMVIAAVLAAIAIPSYNNYVRQSRRTEAKSALLDLASMEERYFTTNSTYSSTPTDLGYTGANFPVTVGSGYYQILPFVVNPAVAPTAGSPGGTPASYTLVAVPLAGTDQVNDTQCASFSLTSAGVQSSFPSLTCWK